MKKLINTLSLGVILLANTSLYAIEWAHLAPNYKAHGQVTLKDVDGNSVAVNNSMAGRGVSTSSAPLVLASRQSSGGTYLDNLPDGYYRAIVLSKDSAPNNSLSPNFETLLDIKNEEGFIGHITDTFSQTTTYCKEVRVSIDHKVFTFPMVAVNYSIFAMNNENIIFRNNVKIEVKPRGYHGGDCSIAALIMVNSPP